MYQNNPQGLLKIENAGPHHQSFPLRLGWGSEICISNKFSDDAGSGITLEELLPQATKSQQSYQGVA